MTKKVTLKKKVPFQENVNAQTFSEQIANLHPKQKPTQICGQFYQKVEGQTISEHPELTL